MYAGSCRSRLGPRARSLCEWILDGSEGLDVFNFLTGEVAGLAGAAKGATEKVKGMLDEDEQDLAGVLDRMYEGAAETEARCTAVPTLR